MPTAVVETWMHAAPGRVWAVLTDFDSYPDWNPFVSGIDVSQGTGVGARWTVTRGGGDREFSAVNVTVAVWDPPHELSWRGASPRPWMLSGRHSFVLRPEREGTLLVHGERVRGLSTVIGFGGRTALMQAAFRLMNDALQAEVARRAELRPGP